MQSTLGSQDTRGFTMDPFACVGDYNTFGEVLGGHKVGFWWIVDDSVLKDV